MMVSPQTPKEGADILIQNRTQLIAPHIIQSVRESTHMITNTGIKETVRKAFVAPPGII
jgi:hypothetical protein